MNYRNCVTPDTAARTRVLFIHANGLVGSFSNLPNGIGILAAILELNGVNVWMKDYCVEPYRPEILDDLITTNAITLVGISFMTCQAPDAYRIGWIGNPSTAAYLEPLRGVLTSLADARVCLVGADGARASWADIEARPWSLDAEPGELARFSVGIMPQPREEWVKGKCGLKALLYMACGVPCVASPVGAALEFIRHEENGILADSPDEWREAFAHLRDPDLRGRLGRAGRATVEERYALVQAAPRMLELLESVA